MMQGCEAGSGLRIAAVAFALALACVASAQPIPDVPGPLAPELQRTAPTPSEGRGQEQPQLSADDHRTGPSEGKRSNVTSSSKIDASKEAAADPPKAPQHGDDKAANEWLLVVWTAVLAVVTALLVVVAAVQAGLFLVQLRYMRDGLADARMAAEAAK